MRYYIFYAAIYVNEAPQIHMHTCTMTGVQYLCRIVNAQYTAFKHADVKRVHLLYNVEGLMYVACVHAYGCLCVCIYKQSHIFLNGCVSSPSRARIQYVGKLKRSMFKCQFIVCRRLEMFNIFCCYLETSINTTIASVYFDF